MKLKYKFTVNKVGGEYIAAAVGKKNGAKDKVISLNETGAFIFRALLKETDEEAIITSLLKEYDVSGQDAAKSVSDIITALKREDLLE
mgnify:CR=1 FL=1